MYYWTRTGNWVDIISFLILCLFWSVGGLLIVSRTFRLKVHERLLAGIATGFLLFIVLSNLLSQLLPLSVAYWVGAVIIFLAGVLFWLFSKEKPVFVQSRLAGTWLLRPPYGKLAASVVRQLRRMV